MQHKHIQPCRSSHFYYIQDKETPLHFVVREGYTAIALLLLQAVAGKDAKDYVSRYKIFMYCIPLVDPHRNSYLSSFSTSSVAPLFPMRKVKVILRLSSTSKSFRYAFTIIRFLSVTSNRYVILRQC